MPTSILDLPRELRDQIYDSLWTTTPKICLLDKPSMGRILACYKSLLTPETALPLWLLTNKQILSEGTSQMIRHGTWIVRLRSEYNSRHTEGVLSPALSRRLTITLTHPLEGPRPRWPHVVSNTMLRPSKENVECLTHVMNQVSTSCNVRDVRVVLELVREEPNAQIDLSPLEIVGLLRPSVQKLEVVVMREQIYRTYSETFVEAIGAEVKRVGNKVMGSRGDPTRAGFFQGRGFVYTFEKPEGMELCRVDSANNGMMC